MNPENLLYTKEHEWVRVEEEVGTIGITHHAQTELGDVVFVDLPKVGTSFTMNQAFGSVESVKAVSEIYSPLSGTVTEVNPMLADRPEAVNADPYGEGWMIKLKLSTPSELKDLLTAADYSAYISGLQSH